MLRIIETQSLSSRSTISFVSGRARRLSLTTVAVLGLLVAGQLALATPINYGNLSGTSVDYIQVTENSATDPQYFPPNPPVGLFGQPIVSGDSIDFNPQNFYALSDFQAPPVDTTDGYLTFGVDAKSGFAITDISFQEGGALSVGGFGTDSTYVDVSAIGFINVLEVDGDPVGVVQIPINVPFNFGVAGNGTWRLGTEGDFNGFLWTGFQSIDINQYLIDNTNIDPIYGATKITVALDNILKAQSELLAGAFIDKKDFGGLSVTIDGVPVIPEPATWLLLAICGVAAGAARRTR